ncbi:hypothetical protein K431DRAFT_289710 [Polychaeton citri CBS 116435]|uniref:Uncharacterized protein n=1 Tax=Polychaeton citri CBS 116435 TaxID=1314669 RepID=A0A9P4UJV0_9PEZI|nr:hypothetical protein K431DRAFT_289710 [Polychaeton citri CBS 116435]
MTTWKCSFAATVLASSAAAQLYVPFTTPRNITCPGAGNGEKIAYPPVNATIDSTGPVNITYCSSQWFTTSSKEASIFVSQKGSENAWGDVGALHLDPSEWGNGTYPSSYYYETTFYIPSARSSALPGTYILTVIEIIEGHVPTSYIETSIPVNLVMPSDDN